MAAGGGVGVLDGGEAGGVEAMAWWAAAARCAFTPRIHQRDCRRTGRSKTAVTRIIRAFRDEGTLADAKRFGRPRVTTHDIVAAAVVDPFLSAKEIRDELSLSISTATVRRRLKEAGISNFAAAQKPFLPERQRQPRLDFALNHQRWNEEEW
ncbi:hypothetical protein HPB49_003718 [Dermacentor silvarum]|uniref:Uncharacterized protein n=1 Tax=Dermacentor silvarum TaxID=543639 RepID=A0ACB8DU25_DERSI|nr:hypothetical protein HPB49_003718 [Dermacentor silvarum]